MSEQEIKSLEELGTATEAQDPGEGLGKAPVYEQKLDKHGRAYGTGRRKNAVARVWVKPARARFSSTKKSFPSTLHGQCCRCWCASRS